MEAHHRRTVARAAAAGLVFAPHDTTELRFSGARDDLGRVSNQGHGLFAHVSMLVSSDGSRDPLGVVGLQAYGRVPRQPGRARPIEEDQLESWRWWKGVEDVAACVGEAAEVIHLMDREADSIALFVRMLAGDPHRRNHRARARPTSRRWPQPPRVALAGGGARG